MNESKKVDRKLLLDFFLTFSRFEYALKAGGYVKAGHRERGGYPNADPDWHKFISTIGGKVNLSAPELQKAISYFGEPPMRAVLNENRIYWDSDLPPSNSDTEKLIKLIKRVRNNLFHGNKYDNEAHEPPERTEILLKYSLILLKEFISVEPDVKKYFDSASM